MSDNQMEIDSTMLKDFCPDLQAQSQSEQKLSTQESVPEIKKTIYQIKSNTLENDTQITNSSKILEMGLTSSEKALTPYWNESCREILEKLLSRTKIDYVGLDLISLGKLQNITTAKSWFSITHNSPLKQSLFKTPFHYPCFLL